MDLQQFINAMGNQGQRERSNYHATLGDLIEKLKNADDSMKLSPDIVGIGAYRGYYTDIALCTQSGSSAFKTEYDYESTEDWSKWQEENEVEIDFSKKPSELAKELESLIGLYFDGYKGGYNEITLDKPLWVAEDYGDCSDIAVVGITDNLELITKKID